MFSWIEPNLHPIVVHFAYALTLTATLGYILSFLWANNPRGQSIKTAADWMLAFGALAILVTVGAGFYAYYTVAHDTPSHEAMTTHRNWVVPSASAIFLLAMWRWFGRREPVKPLLVGLLSISAVFLSIGAWWGGHAVYQYGIGVKSLPAVEEGSSGHDHAHGPTPAKSDGADGEAAGHGHGDGEGHDEEAMEDHHENSADAEAMEDHHESAPASTSDGAMMTDHPDDGHSHGDKDISGAAAMPSMEGPVAVVDAFQSGLRSSNVDQVMATMMADAIIVEGGSAQSPADYAGHHMVSDMAYVSAIETKLVKRDVIAGDRLATVISELRMHGTYKDEAIDNQLIETMVLKNTDQGWRIAHVHWSSKPITGDHEH